MEQAQDPPVGSLLGFLKSPPPLGFNLPKSQNPKTQTSKRSRMRKRQKIALVRFSPGGQSCNHTSDIEAHAPRSAESQSRTKSIPFSGGGNLQEDRSQSRTGFESSAGSVGARIPDSLLEALSLNALKCRFLF